MKITRLCSFALGLCVLVMGTPAAAHADFVTFNFEDLAIQSGLTMLTLSSGGLTATLTRPGSNFAIVDATNGGPTVPALFGHRNVSPFDNPRSNTPFILTFSQAISAMSVSMGDFGQDTDVLNIAAYSGVDGMGALLGTASLPLGPLTGDPFTYETLGFAFPARSAVFIGGSTAFPNSVFYDNITVNFTPVATTAPEPGTLALLASGLVGVGFVRRKKRN